jgi:uncharacterized protein (DUF2336 family)
MFDEQWPRLEGLFALSTARGLDVRPTLLRVLTDLFVEPGPRSDTEIRRYAELASHLVEQVDEDTRYVVAGKLASSRQAPRAVLDKLLAAEPEAACRIIAHSPLLSPDDLWTLAADGGPMTLAAIASRADIDGELTRFLARSPYPLVAETLVLNPRAPIDRETTAYLAPGLADSPDLAARLAQRRGVEPAWLGALFLLLDRDRRAAMVEAFRAEVELRRAATRDSLIALPAALLAAIESAALSRRRDALVGCLADALDVEPALGRRILDDEGGEPLALTLVAIGMPGDQAARVLMFACPAAGESVERLRALSLMMELTPRLAAARLVRAMIGGGAAATAARHEQLFAEAKAQRLPAQGQPRREAPSSARETGRKA